MDEYEIERLTEEYNITEDELKNYESYSDNEGISIEEVLENKDSLYVLGEYGDERDIVDEYYQENIGEKIPSHILSYFGNDDWRDFIKNSDMRMDVSFNGNLDTYYILNR